MNPRRSRSHDGVCSFFGSGKPSPCLCVQKPTGRRRTGGEPIPLCVFTTPGYAEGGGHDMIDPSKLAEMMQKAQQMQEQLQQELATKTVTGEAGGGMVRVVLNGMMEVKSVKIDKAAIDPSDPSLLEDLVRAAVSQAIAQAEEACAEHTRNTA